MKPPAMRRAVSGDHRSLPTRTVGQSIGVGAGTAAVHEDEVVVVRERLFDAAEDRAVVGEFLAAGDGGEGAGGQVGAGLAVLPRALEVECVDGQPRSASPSCPVRKILCTNMLKDNRSVWLPLPFARGGDALGAKFQPDSESPGTAGPGVWLLGKDVLARLTCIET